MRAVAVPATRKCRTCGWPFRPVGKARYCSDDCRHGTDAGYTAGSKCERCRRAHSRARKRSRVIGNSHVPAVGTHRRVQALARLGWSGAELSRRLGKHRSYLLKVLHNDTLETETALAVRALYDELSMTWCTMPTAGRVAADARRRGWAPPLAWDDWAIDDPDAHPAGHVPSTTDYDASVVERILNGERIPATPAERLEVVRRWTADGRSLASLDRHTGWNTARDLRRAS